jgi:chemotaxis protein MotB
VARKKREEEGEENSERWLLTYSDLITLLLELFIILYSIAEVNASKFNAISEQFREQMGGQSPSAAATSDPVSDPVSDPAAEASRGDLDQVFQQLQEYIEQNHLQGSITISSTDDYVRIRMKDAMMFAPDSAVLLNESIPIMKEIQRAIGLVYDEVESILIGGHTADAGDHSLESDQISWRLSTERALTVLESFVANGLKQNKLSIQGFAYFDPVTADGTEGGMALNRRVEITIYRYNTGT